MEQRLHPRFPTNLEGRLSELNRRERTGSGHIADISESGVCVCLPIALTVGEVVQLEIGDSLLYGQIVYVKPDDETFRTGVYVEQVLLGTSDLTRILQSVLRDRLPGTRGLDREIPVCLHAPVA